LSYLGLNTLLTKIFQQNIYEKKKMPNFTYLSETTLQPFRHCL